MTTPTPDPDGTRVDVEAIAEERLREHGPHVECSNAGCRRRGLSGMHCGDPCESVHEDCADFAGWAAVLTHARTDVPALLAEVERLRLRAARAELQRDAAKVQHEECHHAFDRTKARLAEVEAERDAAVEYAETLGDLNGEMAALLGSAEARVAAVRKVYDRLGRAVGRADEFWTTGDWEAAADAALIGLRAALERTSHDAPHAPQDTGSAQVAPEDADGLPGSQEAHAPRFDAYGVWCSCGYPSCDLDLHAEHVAERTRDRWKSFALQQQARAESAEARVAAVEAKAWNDAADLLDSVWNRGHDDSVHPNSHLLRERAALAHATPSDAPQGEDDLSAVEAAVHALLLSDAMTGNDEGTPSGYYIDAENIEHLVRTVIAAANPTPSDALQGEGHRDALGRRVREVWVAWAQQQSEPKPSWLVGWDDLPESDREVDRRIGAALWDDGFAAGLDARADGDG